MAYSTINKSTAHFDTNLYQANGSGKTISGMDFQPDMIFTKNRSTGSYIPAIVDSVRGGTKKLFTCRSDAESTDANAVTSFTSDGYVFGSSGSFNYSTDNYVNWCWKAGGSNTSFSSSGSGNNCYNAGTHNANTTAGFSIVKYTGRNTEISNGQTTRVKHGLGVKPDYFIIKAVTNKEWIVFKGDDNDANLHLNKNHAVSGAEYIGNQGLNTSDYFVVGNDSHVNDNGVEYIAYVFANKTGFSASGVYKGNSSSSQGSFIYTGFKPKWLMVKRRDSLDWWGVWDSKRLGYNGANKHMRINEETYTETDKQIDLLSNGFKIRESDTAINASGGDYLYLAFGQSLVGSNNIPSTAR